MKLIKKEGELQVLKNQLSITSSLLPDVADKLYLQLLKKENILRAIQLAKNARINLDPYISFALSQKLETDDIEEQLLIKIKERLKNNIFETKKTFPLHIPKNKYNNRFGSYWEFEDYVLKFLVGYVIMKNTSLPSCIFAGRSEIFDNIDYDTFEKEGRLFIKWQYEQLYTHDFEYVAAIDVKGYYSNINSEILLEKLSTELGCEKESDFFRLMSSMYKKLTISSWSDHYIQNFYLKELDLLLCENNKIIYGRISDDIRIFSKTEKEVKDAIAIIAEYFNNHGLEINYDKGFLIQPPQVYGKQRMSLVLPKGELNDYEFENLMRRHSTNLYVYSIIDDKNLPREFYTFNNYLENEKGYFLDEIEITKYCENIKTKSDEISKVEIDNLFKILEHFYGSYKFYNSVAETLFASNYKYEETKLLLVDRTMSFFNNLINKERETYRIYIILRQIFFNRNTKDGLFKKFYSSPDISSEFRDLLIRLIFVPMNNTTYIELFGLNLEKTIMRILLNFFDKAPLNDWRSPIHWIELIEAELSQRNSSNVFRESYYKKLYEIFKNRSGVVEKYIEAIWMSKYKYEADYKEIISLSNEFYELTGRDDFLFKKAFSYEKIKDYKNALISYTTYLGKYENSTAALNNRALVKESLNDLAGALSDYEKAIGINPEETLFKNNRDKLLKKINRL